MQNEKFRNAIHEAMERDYRNLTKTSEKHVFSDKFEKKMHKLIQRRNKPLILSISLDTFSTQNAK